MSDDSHDSRSYGPAFCDTCQEVELDDHDYAQGVRQCDQCWDKEVLGDSYFDDERTSRFTDEFQELNKSSIRKVSANPRDVGNLWRPRTQEHTGGFNPREVLDLQINPNEDDDDLAHNSRNTTEDTESREQADPDKRREKAMRELLPGLQHIQIKPEVMSDVIERSPRFEDENKLLESRLGVDLGARGLSFSAGAHRGTVRSDTPYVNYGRGTTNSFGKSESLLKAAKERFKSRKYEDDEDDEKPKKKSNKRDKKSNKRPAKKGKAKKKGSKKMPMPKGRSPPPSGGMSQGQMPLKFRNPGQYNQQQSNKRMKNPSPMGASPMGGGMPQGKGTQLPSSPKMGTRMPMPMREDARKPDKLTDKDLGDPLGAVDPLMTKAKSGFDSLSRTEIIGLKKKIEALMRKLDKLAKAGVENEAKDKMGATPNKDTGTAPQGGTENDEKPWMFYEDATPLLVAGVVGKK